MGTDPDTADSRLWFHGAWLCQAGEGPEHFVEILHGLGVPIPGLIGWVIIVVELVGGLAVLIGAFVPLVSSNGDDLARINVDSAPA